MERQRLHCKHSIEYNDNVMEESWRGKNSSTFSTLTAPSIVQAAPHFVEFSHCSQFKKYGSSA